jgi:hypothetical protein
VVRRPSRRAPLPQLSDDSSESEPEPPVAKKKNRDKPKKPKVRGLSRLRVRLSSFNWCQSGREMFDVLENASSLS